VILDLISWIFLDFGAWCLGFIWILVLGAWDLFAFWRLVLGIYLHFGAWDLESEPGTWNPETWKFSLNLNN